VRKKSRNHDRLEGKVSECEEGRRSFERQPRRDLAGWGVVDTGQSSESVPHWRSSSVRKVVKVLCLGWVEIDRGEDGERRTAWIAELLSIALITIMRARCGLRGGTGADGGQHKVANSQSSLPCYRN